VYSKKIRLGKLKENTEDIPLCLEVPSLPFPSFYMGILNIKHSLFIAKVEKGRRPLDIGKKRQKTLQP
jgi:hypothetical protein